ncbi:MAG: hypothetical protein WC451_03360 [Patescibacteria group bacterium]|jgi:hypothetical protein
MKQAKKFKEYEGARGMGFFDIHDEANTEFPNWNYGTAFAYLWRRFGPPEMGCDPYKNLVTYYLTTKIIGLYLTCTPYLNSAGLSFGFCFSKTIYNKLNTDFGKPKDQWSVYTKEILAALCEAMKELKKPTNIRDWYINIEGHVKDKDIKNPVVYSCRAGYGIRPEYFKRFKDDKK